MDMGKLRAFLEEAQIPFSEPGTSPSSLHLSRPSCQILITPGVYYYGANFELLTNNGHVKFNSSANPAKVVGGIDFLVRVRQCSPRLIWARKKLALITGPYPGTPVLVHAPAEDAAEIIPRPPGFNQLHKSAAIESFPLTTDPQRVADRLEQLRLQTLPSRPWASVVADWNRKHSAQFGHELSLGASYIYAWDGLRFLLDGRDLCLDVWRPIPSNNFPEVILLLETLRSTLMPQPDARVPGFMPNTKA
jgi:hypothetical protein